MVVSVRIPNFRKELAKLGRLKPSPNTAILARTMKEIAGIVQDRAVRSYMKRGRGDSPPLPPGPGQLSVRTGHLARSVAQNLVGLPRVVEVGSDVVYAPTHELGSPGRNIPPRPYLVPAVLDALKEFKRLLRRNWQRELSGIR